MQPLWDALTHHGFNLQTQDALRKLKLFRIIREHKQKAKSEL